MGLRRPQQHRGADCILKPRGWMTWDGTGMPAFRSSRRRLLKMAAAGLSAFVASGIAIGGLKCDWSGGCVS